MAGPGRFDVSRALRELAHLLQLRGESAYKVRAYENASRAVEQLTDERLSALVAEGKLTSVPGIGESLAARITELVRDGKSSLLEELRAGLPRGFAELSRIPNLGPKKVEALSAALGVGSVEELEQACRDGRVRGLKGFSAKMEAKILESIEAMRKRPERVLAVDARAEGLALVEYLAPAVERVELAGSLRRWKETVADLDLVAAARDVEAAMDRFSSAPAVAGVESRGDTKCTVRLLSGITADLRVIPPEDWATALHHFTGSKEHHVRLRGLARDRGLTISEWGLCRLGEGGAEEKLPVDSEAALYAALGLPFIPPELREDQGEIEAAQAGDDFADLVTLADLRGAVHCHTVFSDGRNTVEEMARAADALGLEYLTITDHSPTAGYAGGVGLDRLKAQWDEIARVQELVKVRLLRGTESDILESGVLDYPDAVLEQMDVVVASVHNRYGLDEAKMTERLLVTMQLPLFKIWGHPLGRLLLRREPFDCRVEEVLDALAASRGAVEINGDPHRLDFEPKWIRAARARKLPLVISADAHSTAGLGALATGVHLARRGGVRRSEVLNARPVEAFREAVRPRLG